MKYCALTNKVIIHPVKDKEGNCYEHIEITKWLVNNTISPVTGNPIYITDLIADIKIKNKKKECILYNKFFRLFFFNFR